MCRRCTAVWPISFGVIGLGLCGILPVASPAEICAWLLPTLIEYCGVALGRLAYRPQQTWLFGALMGLGSGRLLHRYLVDPGDMVTWSIGGACLLLGLLSVAWRARS